MSIRKAVKLIKRAVVEALKPYRVRIIGGTHDGQVHNAWNVADALSWVRCYGDARSIRVETRRGGFVARLAL